METKNQLNISDYKPNLTIYLDHHQPNFKNIIYQPHLDSCIKKINVNDMENKLKLFRKKLYNINYLDDEDEINDIYPSTK